MGQKVHLVLGSGGARGVAHIGAIEMLEEEGFEIASIVGCSFGAVVGGIYAAGFQQEYKKWLLELTKLKLFSILDFSFAKHGFLKGEKVFNIIQEFTGKHNIEDFNIPFKVVTADLSHNKEVYFDKGDLFKALRASVGIPGVFTPVYFNGRVLIDGGVLNPLPVNLVDKKEGELMVAVNLNGASTDSRPLKPWEKEETSDENMLDWLKSLVQGKNDKKSDSIDLTDISLEQVLLSSYDMTLDRLTNIMLQLHPPDILVEIPRNTCDTFDFHRAGALVEFGKEQCKRAINAYREKHG